VQNDLEVLMARSGFSHGLERVLAARLGFLHGVAEPRPGFLHGVAEALLLPLAFTALGLAWYGPLERAASAPASYSDLVRDTDRGEDAGQGQGAPETWLVDGFNVVQVALLGGRDRNEWWREPQRAELLARAAGFEAHEVTLFVVFDGEREAPDPVGGRVRPVFTPSADEWLVTRVRQSPEPGQLVVVTADRSLAGRVRHHGARVVSPGEFLGRCGPADKWGDYTTI
jgi:hypothetical protein